MFDAHVHIIDPRFPLVGNNGFVPDPFTIADYEKAVDGLGITGGAVISASFQGTEQSFLTAALRELGPSWVGVTQLPDGTTDEEIVALDAAGVRGLRFNLRRGAFEIGPMTEQAVRAHDLVGWHSEFYVGASLLRSLNPVLAKLPAVSIDYLGLSREALPYLLELADRGVRVKATGFGRLELDPLDAMRQIHRVNPEALMFATDLPSTRARRPFEPSDLDVVAEAVGGDLQAVLYRNAQAWYRVR
ncbi:2-pyrone-4,6-dicarboxylate hydrolase [Rhodococcoides trifolii]|uniref:2-pyrone-4,6-dicarboxylate hydrolase n=1 Tax=Rhodococcoides trifolii TaxID=908250 RepID=A0A917CNE9_9NOCA|nr:amidohydrolase family protein [Rhodococcus trifolii]GGF93912.1 2-pyrone-4,6-dicarboxylate hydrolase [Rhodococcus trifolii]